MHRCKVDVNAVTRVVSPAAQDNTAGSFDEPLYRYGVSEAAQLPPDAEQCYHVNLKNKADADASAALTTA